MGGIVPNKQIATRLFAEGRFGNGVAQYETLDEACRSGDFPITIRTRRAGGGPCIYSLDSENSLTAGYHSLLEKGYTRSEIYFNATVTQDEWITLQGEVMRSPDLVLYYSKHRAKMREAYPHMVQTHGLQAKMLLQGALDPSSYDDLMELLDDYPDSVVEFSCFDRPVGTALTRNTIFWEVRNY